MNNSLVTMGKSVYRCLAANHAQATLVTGTGHQDVALTRVKPLPAATFHLAFDEWPRLSRERKAAYMADAVISNPDMGWRAGAVMRITGNMPIFDHCVLKTSLLVRKGLKHYGCRRILEAARFDTDLQMIDVSFKINNNVVPDIARLLTVMFPEVPQGFFELRNNPQRGAAA